MLTRTFRYFFGSLRMSPISCLQLVRRAIHVLIQLLVVQQLTGRALALARGRDQLVDARGTAN